MKLKDKIVNSLIDFGKRHRLFIYPTLALIALISAITNVVYWGKGNGRKLTASVLVMVMLITQSLFLTSSANETGNTGDVSQITATPSDPGTEDNAPEQITLNIYLDGMLKKSIAVQNNGSGNYVWNYSSINMYEFLYGSADFSQFYELDGFHKQLDYSDPASVGSVTITKDELLNGDTYNTSYRIDTRHRCVAYKVTIKGNSYDMDDIVDIVAVDNSSFDNPSPAVDYTVKSALQYSLGVTVYKYGYKYAGVKFLNADYAIGDTKEINGNIDAELVMSPYDITVKYNLLNGENDGLLQFVGSNTETFKDVIYTYGEDIAPLTTEAVNALAIWDGYELTGWKDDNNNIYSADGTLVNSSALATNLNENEEPNVEGKTLTAIWEYKNVNVKIETDSESESTANVTDGVVNINGVYGDNLSHVLSAAYTDDTISDKLTYNISASDKFELQNLGFAVSEVFGDSKNVIGYRINGTIKKVDNYTFKFEVTDNNIASGNKVVEYSVNINLRPMEVTIDETTVKDTDNNTVPNKVYNGENGISVNGTATINGLLTGDNVVAVFDTNAMLDDPDAGEEKAITLYNVRLVDLNNDNNESTNYKLIYTDEENKSVKVPSRATVNQATIKLNIALKEGYDSNILFGEETPKYSLRIDDISKLAQVDQDKYNVALSSDNAVEQFLEDNLGFIGWKSQRLLYSKPDNYRMSATFDSTVKNYCADATNLETTFNVSRNTCSDKVVLEGKKNNNFYNSLVIKPDIASGYDKIRLVTDGDIDTNYTKQQAESLFSNMVNVTDVRDGEVKYQLLNSATGEITYLDTITELNVDTIKPIYNSFSVTPIKEYFNEFGFGSYYHAQEIDGQKVERVTLKLTFSDENSGCNVLHYYFADVDGNEVGDLNRTAPFTKDPVLNTATASINIGTGDAGQLVVWGEDLAGNESVKYKIKLNDESEFDKNNENSNTYYEWMIENIIEGTDVDVLDNNADIAIANTWYNYLKFKADAYDDDSGLNRIEWNVEKPDGTSETIIEKAGSSIENVQSQTSYGKFNEYTFSVIFDENTTKMGKYKVSGTLFDNAGNQVPISSTDYYMLDTKAPVITDNTVTEDGKFKTSVDINFTVAEGTDESGVYNVNIYKVEGYNNIKIASFLPQDDYSHTVDENGEYIIEAIDNAGNVSTHSITLSKLSTQIPDAPIITLSGELGSDDWYINEYPTVNIKSIKETEDKTPVKTYYKIINGLSSSQAIVMDTDFNFDIATEGNITLEAWSVSESGQKSTVVEKQFKVDITKPLISVLESSNDSDGSLLINFKIEESESGLNLDRIIVNGIKCSVSETNGYYVGNFKVDSKYNYTLTAEDNAGNISKEFVFEPLTINVYPLTNITSSEASIVADIIPGTYEIEDYYISYKKEQDSRYARCNASIETVDEIITLKNTFENLQANTTYDYKVYAITTTSKEVCVYDGKFTTNDKEAKATVTGEVTYDSNMLDSLKTYPIYVSMFKGNTYIASVQLNSEEEKDYVFNNISDGSYQIVATNGLLTLTETVEVTNGGISYPDNYLLNGGVDFVLSGLNTEVILLNNKNITISGVYDIYDLDLYNGNITDEDLDVVANGGTINIKVYAGFINVADVNSNEVSILYEKIGTDGVVVKYISIYIVKEVKDANGNLVNGTPYNINRLAEPLRITFPLEELSGQTVYVATVHKESEQDYIFNNWEDNSIITNNYVTVTTDMFSTYALYQRLDVKKNYEVQFVDGDGNVMKTETVVEGGDATPPSEVPTKAANSKFKYEFVSWDKDYRNISSDTKITALFKAIEINSEDNNSGSDDGDIDTEDPKPPLITPPDENLDEDKPSTSPNIDDYLGSGSNEPQTSDEMPIAMLIITLMGSMLIVYNLKRKTK